MLRLSTAGSITRLGLWYHTKGPLVRVSSSCLQIHLLRLDPLCLLEDLPPDDIDHVDRDANIARHEFVDLEGHESCETVEKDDKDGDGKCQVSAPWQQRIPVRHHAPRNSLCLHSLDHAVVADEDGDPVQRTEYCDKRDKVAKDCARRARNVHESQSYSYD